jgi:tetratricopeptide (TPR) repeat protein
MMIHRVAACALAMTITAGTGWSQNARQRLAALQERARVDSNDAVVNYQLGAEYFRQKKWDEAERWWRVAVMLAPQYADPLLGLAMLPESRGESYWRRQVRERGEGYLDSVMQASMNYVRLAFLADPMVDLSILGEFKEPSPGIQVRNGVLYLQRQYWWMHDFVRGVNELRVSNNSEAYDLLEKILSDPAVRQDRTDAPNLLLWYHGLAAARTGHVEQAGYDFAVLTGRGVAEEKDESGGWLPNDTNLYRFMMSLMNFMGGKIPEAIAGFRRALEFDVGLYQANVQLARIFEAVGRWEDAVREREQAVAVNPEDPTLLIDLGATLLKAGQLDRAQEVLTQAVDLAPRDPRAPLSLGLAALQRGDSLAARRALARFLVIAPSSFSLQIEDAKHRLSQLPERP